jgi:hypothetical protein
MGDGAGRRFSLWGLRGRAFGGQRKVEQAVGVVEGRAEDLAAGEVLEGGRDAPVAAHGAGVERPGGAETGQVVR